MLLQLAIDQPDALPVVRQVADLVDIVEVGTPLLKRFGLASISGIRELAPNVPVLVDTEAIWIADPASPIGALFFKVAFLGYLSVFVNLNPLLELDGYFILSDWLGIPMLRQRSFT
ncbi:MAG: hypothetical protein P8Y05_15470, partial [Deinococcales bacterium]